MEKATSKALEIIAQIGDRVGNRPVGNLHAYGSVLMTPQLEALYHELQRYMPFILNVAMYNGAPESTITTSKSNLEEAIPHIAQIRLIQVAKANNRSYSSEEERIHIAELQRLGVYPAIIISGPKREIRVVVGKTPDILHSDLLTPYLPTSGNWQDLEGVIGTGYLVTNTPDGYIMFLDGDDTNYIRKHIYPHKKTKTRPYGTIIAPVYVRQSKKDHQEDKHGETLIVTEDGKAILLTDPDMLIETAKAQQGRVR